MHHILLRTVVIDAPSEVHDRERDFWTTALAAHARRGNRFPEYHVLEQAASLGPVMIQDVGTDGPRMHLDIECDDIAAEVGRLVTAGATVVQQHEEWVVLRDPAGLLFCVVPGDGEEFHAAAKPVR